jgi:hypothetical protein
MNREDVKAAIKGFKTLEEAQRFLGTVGDDYVICKVVASQFHFEGEILAYLVVHKDADPLHDSGEG